jgi:hypothetical protein
MLENEIHASLENTKRTLFVLQKIQIIRSTQSEDSCSLAWLTVLSNIAFGETRSLL